MRVQAALLLVRAGFIDIPEIDQLVPTGTDAAWPTVYRSDDGLSPYLTWFGLRTVRLVQGRPPSADHSGATAPPDNERDAGLRRFVAALSLLADLEAQEVRARLGLQPPPAVAGS
jgi:hypothetical protein